MKPIKEPKVLVVEGKDDENFFSALNRHLGIEDIQIVNCGGKTGIPPTIQAITKCSNFYKIEYIVVARDADDYPNRAFQSVFGSLEDADLAVPEKPFEIVGEKPKVAVMILPNGKDSGELEDLCIKAVKDDPAMVCVKQYFDCLEEQLEFLPGNLSKAKIHAFLASREKTVKTLGIAAQVGYLPWDNPVFSQIKKVLNAFPTRS